MFKRAAKLKFSFQITKVLKHDSCYKLSLLATVAGNQDFGSRLKPCCVFSWRLETKTKVLSLDDYITSTSPSSIRPFGYRLITCSVHAHVHMHYAHRRSTFGSKGQKLS